MRIGFTGAGGLVGRAIVPVLLAAGHEVVALSRGAALPRHRFSLDAPPPPLGGFDALVHCAFDHVPGCYRGGEGRDPEGFVARNLHGSCALFERAARDGVGRIIFLSSRAVYDGAPPGSLLEEHMPTHPTSLYGQVKAGAEACLAGLDVSSVALRATGVYAPGSGHKWASLFRDYLAGKPIAPRVGSEVHGEDLAAAVSISLNLTGALRLNVSDILLDRHDLLHAVALRTGCGHPLPVRADAGRVSCMSTERLRAHGWVPGGMPRLTAALPALLADATGDYCRAFTRM